MGKLRSLKKQIPMKEHKKMAFARKIASIPVSKVEIHIKCSNLLNKDVTSKSDPCVVIYQQDKGHWYEHGRTENIKNNLNPEFATTFELDYYFEEVQNLMVAVYDIDNKSPQLNDDDFLGSIECTLGQVVSSGTYTKPLMIKSKPAGKGTISIRAEEISKLNDVFHMRWYARKLDNKDLLSKSDPYLVFSRQSSDGSWQVVHRTEVIKDNLNPQWKPFEIKCQKLCAGDYDRTLKGTVYDHDDHGEPDVIGEFTFSVPQILQAVDKQVDCYDYDSDGSHDFIGTFSTTASEMVKAVDTKIEFPCINPKKKAKKKSYQNSGVVTLASCQITKEYSFLDYIFSGLQINFTVGIDFTASNGNPTTPQSLHYIHPYEPNEYQKAIQAVGAVIQDYDSDQMFPALGFGAKVPPDFQPSHEFAINFNSNNPFCAGVQGVCAAYTACVNQIQLYGPTNFSPIINHVAQFARAAQKEQGARNYFVLLIITDGVISDMSETLGAIVTASSLPMSIIIVGVGQANFEAMDVLDGDNGELRTPYGEKAKRDIVQFVPFRDFNKAPPAELAKHVLAEVPKQVCDYYKMVKIFPTKTGTT